MSSTAIRALLVDDHPAVLQGLATLLDAGGIQVCAQAGGSKEALQLAADLRPDIAIVDLSLDGEDGTGLIAELCGFDLPVLVYSMHKDAAHVSGAFAAGALGYVTKREFQGILLQAARAVADGRRFASPAAAAALAEGAVHDSLDEAIQKLSPNERRVYELIGKGTDTADIAAALGITINTVESYYGRILVKLNISGMHELRRRAIDSLLKRNA